MCSVKLETIGGRNIEYIDHCQPNLLIYKLLTSTDDDYECGFVRNQGNRDIQFKSSDHAAAERGHMYITVRMSNLFGFVNDLGKIKYGLGFKLILKNNNDRALFRVIAGFDAVANDGNIYIRGISWCVPSIDPSNDNRIIVQKRLNKKNNTDFS